MTSLNPKISIITINRNNAVGLDKTICSVVSQTYKGFEYIVIDGASTDESVNIIHKYSPHIHYWISEKDKGIYDAMNKGIEKAQGEYMLFLNSGDALISDNILERIYNLIQNDDVIYFDLMIGANLYHFPEYVSLKLFTYNSLPHNASFIRSSLLKQRPYSTQYKISGDMEWFLWLMTQKGTFRKEPIALIHYDNNGISAVTRGKAYKALKEEKNRILESYFPPYILIDYKGYSSPFMGFVLRIEKLSPYKKNITKWFLRAYLFLLEKI